MLSVIQERVDLNKGVRNSTSFLLFKMIFLMWIFFLNWICTILLLFYALVSWPRGMWHSSSQTKDWTYTPYIRRWSRKWPDLQGSPSNSFLSESDSHSAVSDSLGCHGLYSPWNSPGQNTGVGSLSLLQGIVPTQGSNPGLPHCRQILYQLGHKGSLILF